LNNVFVKNFGNLRFTNKVLNALLLVINITQAYQEVYGLLDFKESKTLNIAISNFATTHARLKSEYFVLLQEDKNTIITNLNGILPQRPSWIDRKVKVLPEDIDRVNRALRYYKDKVNRLANAINILVEIINAYQKIQNNINFTAQHAT
jgi:hypothetical protein